MDDLRFKDIRVSSTALDLKANTSKNTTEILNQLQTGSMLKGLVIGKTLKGYSIFHTAYGRFSLPNNQGLTHGDKITIQILDNTKQFQATIVSVNDKLIKNPEAFSLLELKLVNDSVAGKVSNASALNPEHLGNIPAEIRGQVTYLNLSKISKQSILYKELVKTTSEKMPISIIFQVKPFLSKAVSSALTVTGEIASKNNNNSQLIKTDFGVVTIEGTRLPIGKKLSLDIISLNNSSIDINIERIVASFVLNINKNHLSEKLISQSTTSYESTANKLENFVQNNSSKSPTDSILQEKIVGNINNQLELNASPKIITSQTQDANNAGNRNVQQNFSLSIDEFSSQTQTNVNKLIQELAFQPIYMPWQAKKTNSRIEDDKKAAEKILRDDSSSASSAQVKNSKELTEQKLGNFNMIIKNLDESIEEIKRFIDEYSQVKELLVPNVDNNDQNQKWHTVFIPFYNGQTVEEREVRIARTSDNYLRFIININFEDTQIIQLDGLVKFRENTKVPVTFDMICRSIDKLDSDFQKEIADIFLTSKEITGISGQMQFEEAKNLDYPLE